MRDSERALYEMLNDGDSLEPRGGVSRSSVVGAALGNIVGNPNFKAQFNITVKTRFREVTTDLSGNITTDVIVAPAGLPAGQQTQLPLFTFGQADFQGGYDKAKNLLPLSGWNVVRAGIVDKDNIGILGLGQDFITTGVAKTGDMIIYLIDDLANLQLPVSTTFYVAEVLIQCPQVAYGTLLDSSSSDSFIINMVRYKVDITKTEQFDNQIRLLKQTLFGRAGDDKVDPNTYITGQTFNANIADIPLEYPIDKNRGMHSYINYDVQSFTWVITVATTKKTTI